jgi:hypothetical protein
VTNASGIATDSSVATTGWAEGVYTISPNFAGTTSCGPSTDQATLTVGSAGDSATGGGSYNLPGSGRINFGFTIQTVPNTNPTQYKGQILLINNGKWRLKGSFSGVNAYTKTGSHGAANGTGDLYWWNQSANGGLGAWQLAKSPVSFTISFDKGTNIKKACGQTGQGCFGIQITYTPISPQPSTLPNSAVQPIKGGSIRVN